MTGAKGGPTVAEEPRARAGDATGMTSVDETRAEVEVKGAPAAVELQGRDITQPISKSSFKFEALSAFVFSRLLKPPEAT